MRFDNVNTFREPSAEVGSSLSSTRLLGRTMTRTRSTRLRSKGKRAKRHVTIREVAKAARASVSTVSAALNNSDYVSADMRGRIEDAIKALRYRPNDLARGLRLQRTHSIAIVVPDLSNNFYIELVR